MDELTTLQQRERKRKLFLDKIKREFFIKEEFSLSPIGVLNVYAKLARWMLCAGMEPEVLTDDRFKKRVRLILEFDIVPKILDFTPNMAERAWLCFEIADFALEQVREGNESEMLRLSVPPARETYLREIGMLTATTREV